MGRLVQAARSGKRRDILTALRDDLAMTIENTDSGRDIAALTRRLLEVIAELDGLPDEFAEPDEMDDALAELS